MLIKYDNKRKDITFCTMLFKMPEQENLTSIKKMNRKFEDFYLPSLKHLIETFKKVCLWCDIETATYIKKNGLEKYVDMHVIKFTDLPHYHEKEEWLQILNNMYGNVGYLFHHKKPIDWIDYLILIMAKPAVMDWAAIRNKFKTKYFMWLDAGAFNPMYADVWANWDGVIRAKPERIRLSIHITMGKTRPHFVPNFIYRLYCKIKSAIPPATKQSLVKQSLLDIGMINADYDVAGCCIMGNAENIHKFYNQFEIVRKIMKNHGVVSTEQAVFLAMMKLDTSDMFELAYGNGYTGVYANVAKLKPDLFL